MTSSKGRSCSLRADVVFQSLRTGPKTVKQLHRSLARRLGDLPDEVQQLNRVRQAVYLLRQQGIGVAFEGGKYILAPSKRTARKKRIADSATTPGGIRIPDFRVER